LQFSRPEDEFLRLFCFSQFPFPLAENELSDHPEAEKQKWKLKGLTTDPLRQASGRDGHSKAESRKRKSEI